MNRADLSHMMGRLTVQATTQHDTDGLPVGPMGTQTPESHLAHVSDWVAAETKERVSLRYHTMYNYVTHQHEVAVPPNAKENVAPINNNNQSFVSAPLAGAFNNNNQPFVSVARVTARAGVLQPK